MPHVLEDKPNVIPYDPDDGISYTHLLLYGLFSNV